jgi:hypothetical protein
LSDGGCFPNLVWNCCWTIVTDRHLWNVSTQNAFSLPFAAILVNCAPSGEMHNYCTPHTIKENFENFLIHRCNYILLSQVYCVWQVVKTLTIIFNNPVCYLPHGCCTVRRLHTVSISVQFLILHLHSGVFDDCCIICFAASLFSWSRLSEGI